MPSTYIMQEPVPRFKVNESFKESIRELNKELTERLKPITDFSQSLQNHYRIQEDLRPTIVRSPQESMDYGRSITVTPLIPKMDEMINSLDDIRFYSAMIAKNTMDIPHIIKMLEEANEQRDELLKILSDSLDMARLPMSKDKTRIRDRIIQNLKKLHLDPVRIKEWIQLIEYLYNLTHRIESDTTYTAGKKCSTIC